MNEGARFPQRRYKRSIDQGDRRAFHPKQPPVFQPGNVKNIEYEVQEENGNNRRTANCKNISEAGRSTVQRIVPSISANREGRRHIQDKSSGIILPGAVGQPIMAAAAFRGGSALDRRNRSCDCKAETSLTTRRPPEKRLQPRLAAPRRTETVRRPPRHPARPRFFGIYFVGWALQDS